MLTFQTESQTGGVRAVIRSCVRTFFVTLLFGSVMAATAPSMATKSNKDLCLDALTGPPVTTDFYEAPQLETALVVGTEQGQHGFPDFILNRSSGPWLSNLGIYRYAPQGDPRWFVAALGEEVARYFDFEIRNAETMLIPGVRTFSAAVRKINTVLARRHQQLIGLDYDDGDISAKPLSLYLDKFTGDTQTLQFAPDGHHLVHDMSFHSGSLILPNELLHVARDRIRFVRDFFQFALGVSAQSNPNLQQSLQAIKRLLSFYLVRGVDNGTGFGNILMIANHTEDPYIIGQFKNLMAVRNDIPTNRISRHGFGIVMASHLTFGGDSTVYFKDPDRDYSFTLPRNVKSVALLKDYTLYVLKHFLRVYIIKGSLALNQASPSHKIRQMESYLNFVMLDFLRTREGRKGELNLYQTLSPFGTSKQTGVGFEFDDKDANYWNDRFSKKQRNIMSAARFLQRGND